MGWDALRHSQWPLAMAMQRSLMYGLPKDRHGFTSATRPRARRVCKFVGGRAAGGGGFYTMYTANKLSEHMLTV